MPITRDGTGATLVTMSSAAALTITFTTTADRFLVITGCSTGISTPCTPTSITDSGSGSWTILSKVGTAGLGSGIQVAWIAYSENRASITSITVNFPASTFGHAKLDQYTGVKTTGAFDTSVTAEGTVGSQTFTSANLTAGNPDCLIVSSAMADDSAPSTWTAPGGAWTETYQFGDTSTNTAGQGAMQIAVGSTGPFSQSYDYPPMNGTGYAGTSLIASFLPGVIGARLTLLGVG